MTNVAFTIEQTSPTKYRITLDGAFRGEHDLVGLLQWSAWARESGYDISVKSGFTLTPVTVRPSAARLSLPDNPLCSTFNSVSTNE